MAYKLAGTLLLLLVGGYLSAVMTRFERRRLRVLDGYISLLSYVRGQIDCYARPLTDILAGADPQVLAACLGLDANEPFPPLSAEGEPPLPALIKESRLYLEPESERLLLTMTGELGGGYRAEQVSRCDYYLTALLRERGKLNDTLPSRRRGVSVLCVCSTLGLALLLW